MKTGKIGILAFYFFSFLLLNSCQPQSGGQLVLPQNIPVNIGTLNLRFFGTGGGFNRPGVEPRTRYLIPFIKQELFDLDVVLFSEAMDISLLKQSLSSLWDCESYHSHESSPWHQNLALCFKPQRFFLEKYDHDWEIPEHRLDRRGLRPALQARLCLNESKTCFLQIIGVHLKAGKESATRLDQIKVLAETLKNQGSPIPTIVLGDFNSYSKERSGLAEDDITLFENLLSESSQGFRSLTRGLPTFGTGATGREYDHIVASAEIKDLGSQAYPACAKIRDPTVKSQLLMQSRLTPRFLHKTPDTRILTLRSLYNIIPPAERDFCPDQRLQLRTFVFVQCKLNRCLFSAPYFVTFFSCGLAWAWLQDFYTRPLKSGLSALAQKPTREKFLTRSTFSVY